LRHDGGQRFLYFFDVLLARLSGPRGPLHQGVKIARRFTVCRINSMSTERGSGRNREVLRSTDFRSSPEILSRACFLALRSPLAGPTAAR
jgi:hypothetical protein